MIRKFCFMRKNDRSKFKTKMHVIPLSRTTIRIAHTEIEEFIGRLAWPLDHPGER
jgi:hypothetical protein